MCISLGGSSPAPPPLQPAPPPPLPPAPPLPTPEPLETEINPQVRRAKQKRGDKSKSQYSDGTGSLRIRLNPKINTGMETPSGGIN